MTNIDLAIQIVNYKTHKYIDPLLKSVTQDLTNSNLKYEILILDNASSDDLSGIKEKWSNHNVKIYHSKVNSGFGAGNNFLEKHSSGKLILLISPDMQIIEKNTI
ncbi:MAG TPA: glycosyltransferase, partial [Candidatus Angelobacter sp.]|nr:glycosyltransferase [Candidatus Angelobacter sp.]